MDKPSAAHLRVEEEKLIDRYLVGSLSEEEEAFFEEHLFECAECLQAVESGEDMRLGLRDAAAQAGARAGALIVIAAWLRSRRRFLGSVGLALLLAILPAAVLWREVLGQRAEIDRLRAAASFGLSEPLVDLTSATLGVVRGSGAGASTRLDLGKRALLLSLELPEVTASAYRVTLRDRSGEILWVGDDLQPTFYDSLFIVLPSSLVKLGEYQILVEAGARTEGNPREGPEEEILFEFATFSSGE